MGGIGEGRGGDRALGAIFWGIFPKISSKSIAKKKMKYKMFSELKTA
jgi:hypothetical protein